MNSVETLRAAADHLDELAASASGGTWWAQELSDDEPFGGWEVMNGLVGMQEHQVAATSDFCSTRCRPDALWIATLGPQVAPALSAWLRAEADTAQTSDQTRANFRPSWRDDWSPNDPPPDWSETNRGAALEAMHRHPLAFARMVLGLPAGDAS